MDRRELVQLPSTGIFSPNRDGEMNYLSSLAVRLSLPRLLLLTI